MYCKDCEHSKPSDFGVLLRCTVLFALHPSLEGMDFYAASRTQTSLLGYVVGHDMAGDVCAPYVGPEFNCHHFSPKGA